MGNKILRKCFPFCCCGDTKNKKFGKDGEMWKGRYVINELRDITGVIFYTKGQNGITCIAIACFPSDSELMDVYSTVNGGDVDEKTLKDVFNSMIGPDCPFPYMKKHLSFNINDPRGAKDIGNMICDAGLDLYQEYSMIPGCCSRTWFNFNQLKFSSIRDCLKKNNKSCSIASTYTWRNDQLDEVNQHLQKDDFHANEERTTALMTACQHGQVECVESLLRQVKSIGVNGKNFKDKTALMFACENGHVRCVEKLLKVKGIEINSQNFKDKTALMFACENGHVRCVEKLLKVKGIEVNCQNFKDKTALMFTCENGHVDCVDKLLQVKDIQVNSQNFKDKTALMFACENGHVECVEKLLQFKDIEINSQNFKDKTALMFACENGHVACVNKLLKVKSIEVNCQNFKGKTALMFASENGHVECVAKLLQIKNIDVSCQNFKGKTALMFACENGHVDITNRLLMIQYNN